MWNTTRPPVVGILSLLISIFLHFVFPISKIIFYPYNLGGVLFMGIGLLLTTWGVLTFKKNNTSINPHDEKPKKIIATGPFKFTRNPMYLGILTLLLGIAVLFGSVSAPISPLIFFITVNFGFIPYEERMLGKIFGEEYENYKKKVRRWV